MKKSRPIIIVGKPGTGKTTKALELLETPIIQYANEYDLVDNYSLSKDKGILIEEVHYKANVDLILNSLREYSGQIILTSLNQKDIPKSIKNFCKIQRAGTKNWSQEKIKAVAPNSYDAKEFTLTIFELLKDYLKNSNRDEVILKLKINRPSDFQMLSWLSDNISPNKIAYVDSQVKRKWSQDYFYELLGYSHDASSYVGMNIPKKRARSNLASICWRLKLKKSDEHVIKQLLQDKDFAEYAKTRLNNAECRLLHLGEKTRRKKSDPITPDIKLTRWF
jgi:hypothetical protein